MTTTTPNVIDLLPRQAAALCAAPLRRPRLLVRAAHAGQPAWRRGRDLPALLRGVMPAEAPLPAPGGAAAWLRAEEDRMDEARRDGRGDYDLERHLLLLIALLAELRALGPGQARQPEEAAPAALPR